jgi:hypothetical protein
LLEGRGGGGGKGCLDKGMGPLSRELEVFKEVAH